MNIRKIKNILTSPSALSLLFSSIIILFLFPPFNKYRATLKETIDTEAKNVWYYNLDHDSYSEKISYHAHRVMGTIVTVVKNGKVLDQWNFNDSLADFFPFFGDYDNNRYTEIYIFTRKNDSIFISLFEPFNQNNSTHTRFVTALNLVNNKADYGVYPCALADANNDGFKEFSFIIHAGFSLHPRNLFLYDIKNDTVYRSPQSGTAINNPVVYDLDNNGLPEILVNSHATGNFHTGTISYSDQYCWLTAFTADARFLFEPANLGEYPSSVKIVPYNNGNTTFIAALYRYAGTKKIDCFIGLYSAKGELLKKRNLGLFNEKLSLAALLSADPVKRDRLYLVSGNGEIEQLDSNLATINYYKVPGVTAGFSEWSEGTMDIDNDGASEHFFIGKNKMLITRSDFSEPVSIPQHKDATGLYTVILNGNQKRELFVAGSENSFIFSYSSNPFYKLKFPAYLTVFGLTFVVLYSGKKYYTSGKGGAVPPFGGTIGGLGAIDLTNREKEILRLLAKGRTSQEIGGELNISKNTVDTHRRNILEKTGCKSTTELMNKLNISSILKQGPVT